MEKLKAQEFIPANANAKTAPWREKPCMVYIKEWI
jgi:hypothetical protein